MVPAIAWAVDPEQDRFGWGLTAIVLGIVILASALVIPKLIRNRPKDYNQLPDRGALKAEKAVHQRQERTLSQSRTSRLEGPDFTTGQALRTSAFWCIALGHGLGSMVILAIMLHFGLLMVKDEGFSIQTMAWIVTVYTAVSLLFQLIGGYLGDRMRKNVALFVFTSIQAGAVVLLVFSSSLLDFYLSAVLFGVGFGGRSPLTTSIRGEYFGRASFGRILGASTVPMNVLLLIAAPMAGYIREVRDSYHEAFIILAVLNFIGAVLFLQARKPRLPSAMPQPQPV